MPSIDFRMHLANQLMKLEEYKKSVKVLETVVAEEDEYAETWYLLAFNLTKLKKYESAEECLKNVTILVQKQKCDN